MDGINDLTVCNDCAAAIANNDFTALDNDPASAEERRAQIIAGVTDWNSLGYWLAITEPAGFQDSPCDCCNTWLAGPRHHAARFTGQLSG